MNLQLVMAVLATVTVTIVVLLSAAIRSILREKSLCEALEEILQYPDRAIVIARRALARRKRT